MALLHLDDELKQGLRLPFRGTLALLGLVLLTSMELGHESPVVRLFAGLSFFWLAILFGMTMQDYLTR